MEWWRKRQVLARLRLEWGRLRDRTRDMAAIASYHVAVTADAPVDSLDRRTWDDLDLDEVFAALDRTGSSVGQQCLYHRLRSLSGVTTLDAFESLVQAMSSDAQLRERCQVALSLLAGASGYQVWTLAQPGALVVRPRHALFPTAHVVGMADTGLDRDGPAVRRVVRAPQLVPTARRERSPARRP